MPFPLIPVLIAAGTGLVGVVKGAMGISDMNEAKKTNDQANNKVKYAKSQLNKAREDSNNNLSKLGQTKINVLNHSIQKFIASFEKLKNYEFETSVGLMELNKFVIDKNGFVKLKEEANYATSIAGGLLTGSVGGALTAYGAYSAVGLLGATTATTGATIGGLTGIAAQNATLAWLGGGALSVGGTGVFGGTLVLGGLMLGPALAVGGLYIGAKGAKALDEAKANMAKATKAAAEMNTARDLCKGITERSKMFTQLLEQLNHHFLPLVNRMEVIIQKSGTTYASFELEDKHTIAKAYAIAGAIKSVLDTPILTDKGKLTSESATKVTEIKTFISKL